MKYILLTLLILSTIVTRAQLTVMIPDWSLTPGQSVNVPVRLIGASSSGIPIGGANVQITYDPAVLTFVNLTNFNPATPQSQWFFSGNNGIIAANWLEPNLLTVPITDSAALFEIQFIYTAGSSALHFTVYEFTDAQYNLIPTLAIDGLIHSLPQLRNVTFSVDMSKQVVSSSGVHLCGSFNNWSPSATEMVSTDDSIFIAAVPLEVGQEFTYRFINGNSLTGAESVPAECGINNGSGIIERSIAVPENDTTVAPVCFSLCSACPANTNVTFRVNMSQQTISADGVHLAGSFNAWNTSSIPMFETSDQVYEVSVPLSPGDFHVFRFVNGNSNSGFELVPQACGVPSSAGGFDRYLLIPSADTTLPVKCFSSCLDCDSTSNFVNITFRVDMHNEPLSPAGVHIAGSFQGWQPGTTLMTTNNDSIYYFTQQLQAGSSVEYRFVNGNTANGYEIIPENCAVNGNRYLTIPSQDSVLTLVCFSSCDSCIPIPFASVTFRVDMSMSDISLNGVHLTGDFQGWDPASTLMTGGPDSIFTYTLNLPVNNEYYYRFVNGDEWSNSEIVPEECSSGGNRILHLLQDTTLTAVCFSRCSLCNVNIESSSSIFHQLSIFPNPFCDQTVVEAEFIENGSYQLELIDITGRSIRMISAGTAIKGTQTYSLYGDDLLPGCYLLKLNVKSNEKGKVELKKIIKY